MTSTTACEVVIGVSRFLFGVACGFALGWIISRLRLDRDPYTGKPFIGSEDARKP